MTTTIGRWGRLVEVRASAPRMPSDRTDRGQVAGALSGRRYVQPQATRTRRTWTWDWSGLSDADLAAVEQLVADQRRGRLYWMDPTATGSNMLPAEVAEPVAGVTDVGSASVDGRVWDMVSGQVVEDVPTVAGAKYRVLVRASAASSVTVETLDGDRAVVAAVGAPVNLLANPSFETGTLSGWIRVTNGASTVTVVQDAAATDGDWVAELANPAGDTLTFLDQRGIPAAPGDVFTFGLDVVSATTTVRVLVLAVDAANASLGAVASTSATTPGRVTVATSACPAGTVAVWVRLQLNAGDVGTVRVDTAQLERGDTASPYIDDAGLSGTGLLAAQWTAATEAGVRVTVDGAGWSGAQMFDTALHDGSWRPGRGIPQVWLSGLSQSLLWALSSGDVMWDGAQVTLVEVDG